MCIWLDVSIIITIPNAGKVFLRKVLISNSF